MPENFTKDDLRPHVGTWECGRCRKPITEGHRCVQARISHGKGRDPMNIHNEGLMISDEWEFVHVDCRDPYLKKGLSDG